MMKNSTYLTHLNFNQVGFHNNFLVAFVKSINLVAVLEFKKPRSI